VEPSLPDRLHPHYGIEKFMHDIVVVVVLISACTAIGLPLCLLLPEERFEVRLTIAPPIGLGLFAIGGTVLYLWGVKPWISMAAMATAGFVIGAVFCLRAKPPRLVPPSKSAMALSAGTAAVILICLSPGWTGGSEFRVFQANVYDHMAYLGERSLFGTSTMHRWPRKQHAPSPTPSWRSQPGI
jgi:hypothetical protein